MPAHHFNDTHVHIARPRLLKIEGIGVKDDVSKELMHHPDVGGHLRNRLMRHSRRKLNAGNIFKIAFDGRIQFYGLTARHRFGVYHTIQHCTYGTIRNLPGSQAVAIIGNSLRDPEYLTRIYTRKDGWIYACASLEIAKAQFPQPAFPRRVSRHFCATYLRNHAEHHARSELVDMPHDIILEHLDKLMRTLCRPELETAHIEHQRT